MSFAPRPGLLIRDVERKERAVVLVIGNALLPEDVPALCERARAMLERDAERVVECDVRALVDADVATIDALAQLQLHVRRLGGRIRLKGACRELEELIELAGLCEVLPRCAELWVEAEREPEQREEPLCVEEEAEPGDPAV